MEKTLAKTKAQIEKQITQAMAVDNRGIEQIGQSDLLIPRYILCQALTLFVRNDTTGKIKEGLYYNTLTKQVSQSVQFQPLIMTKYWDLLRSEGNKMVFDSRVFRVDDVALKGRTFYGTKEKKADVNTVLSILCVVDSMPAVISFTKMAYNTGKELYTQAVLSKRALWAQKYELIPTAIERAGNKFFVPKLVALGSALPEEVVLAEQMYETFKSRTEVVNKDVIEEAAQVDETVPF